MAATTRRWPTSSPPPGFVLLALEAIAAAGVVFPDDARRVTGLEPDSPEFAAWHAEQLRRLVERLA